MCHSDKVIVHALQWDQQKKSSMSWFQDPHQAKIKT
jgi:hypothetical protein